MQLKKNTRIYSMNKKIVLNLPKGALVEVKKNIIGEISVIIKMKTTIILFRRENMKVNGRRPIGIYINGDLVGLANYANPPFPLSLIPP